MSSPMMASWRPTCPMVLEEREAASELGPGLAANRCCLPEMPWPGAPLLGSPDRVLRHEGWPGHKGQAVLKRVPVLGWEQTQKGSSGRSPCQLAPLPEPTRRSCVSLRFSQHVPVGPGAAAHLLGSGCKVAISGSVGAAAPSASCSC